MYGLVVSALLAPPWADGPEFPRAVQEKVLAATLRLTNPKTRGVSTAVRVKCRGSDVYYLTAAHGVKDARFVSLESFTSASYPGAAATLENVRVEVSWPDIDIAVLSSQSPPGPCLALCPTENLPAVMETLATLTAGCTDGSPPELLVERVGKPVVVHKDRSSPKVLSWRTEKPGAEGRSGGPMVDAQGLLIGICSGTDGKNGYYSHVSEIRKSLEMSMLRHILDNNAAAEASKAGKK